MTDTYRRKSPDVEAFQLTAERRIARDFPPWFQPLWMEDDYRRGFEGDPIFVATPDGVVEMADGDWAYLEGGEVCVRRATKWTAAYETTADALAREVD